MRRVTVFSTVGKSAEFIDTDAVIWKDLKSLIQGRQINLSNMKSVIGETQNTLESDEGVLPDGDFTVFLMPIKTKSGAELSRKELFEEIKNFVGTDASRKALFIIDGKNMTQLSTPTLQTLYNQHIATAKAAPAVAQKAAPKAAVAPAAKAAVAEVVSNVAASKATAQVITVESAIVFLKNTFKNNASVKEAIQNLEDAITPKEETEAQRLAREKREMQEKLDKRAAEIARNFSDVKR